MLELPASPYYTGILALGVQPVDLFKEVTDGISPSKVRHSLSRVMSIDPLVGSDNFLKWPGSVGRPVYFWILFTDQMYLISMAF